MPTSQKFQDLIWAILLNKPVIRASSPLRGEAQTSSPGKRNIEACVHTFHLLQDGNAQIRKDLHLRILLRLRKV